MNNKIIASIIIIILVVGGLAAWFIFSGGSECAKACRIKGFATGAKNGGQCQQNETRVDEYCCSKQIFSGGASSGNGSKDCLIKSVDDYCKFIKTGEINNSKYAGYSLAYTGLITFSEPEMYKGERACHVQITAGGLITDEYFTQVCPETNGWIVMTMKNNEGFEGKAESQINGKEKTCVSVSCTPEGVSCNIFKSMYGAGCVKQ